MAVTAGWLPGNYGENQVAEALSAAGFSPDTVEQQFRLGRFRLDFAIVKARVAIEADGYHHTTDSGRATDRTRDRQLAKWGWEVHRIDVEAMDRDHEVARLLRLYRDLLRLRLI